MRWDGIGSGFDEGQIVVVGCVGCFYGLAGRFGSCEGEGEEGEEGGGGGDDVHFGCVLLLVGILLVLSEQKEVQG